MYCASRFLIVITLSVLPQLSFAEPDKLTNILSFNDYQSGSIDDWLQGKGFDFQNDMRHRNLIDLDVSENALTLEAKKRAFGIMINESVDLAEFTEVEITWGVNQFPEGASYEQGIRNESLMVFFFLGDERHSSGSWLIPSSPYFVALFLCHGDDKINHPYVGAYYKKTGRYVCVKRPDPGQTVTTRFNILEAYRTYYDKERDDDPAITGIGLALDTKKAGSGGSSSAFIHEIRFINE